MGKGQVVTGESSNVSDLVAEAARTRPDTPAVIDTATGITRNWRDVELAVRATARRLRGAGVEPGDRVGVRLPTSPAFVVSFYAVLRVGAIAVPLNPYDPDLDTILDHSGTRVVVTDRPVESAAQVTRVEPVLDAPNAGDAADEAGSVGTDRGGEDIAALLYTSGTTGAPRGVMLSHRALLANVAQLRSVTPPPVEPSDRVFVAVPMHHVYGLGCGVLTATAAGATLVTAPRFEVRTALSDCLYHRVTVILGVPGMYVELADRPADELGEHLSTVRLLLSGAAPLRPRVLADIREATGLPVYEGYGMTEASPVVTSTLVTGYAKPGSAGRPLPGVEVALVDSDGSASGAPLDPADPDDTFDDADGTGLVAVRGANLFSGYWPDGAHGPDADGWFRTGDVGYVDTDGDLHLVDRAGDVVLVNGFNVYPHEVEDVIRELPQVREVAIVAMLDERSGEAVRAVVVPEPGAALSEQQVIEHCAGRLAGYKVPKVVTFADELPYSVTGKVSRVGLRDAHQVSQDGGHA
ncbi:AMP-binding protein [Saccharomonospora sp. NB11]|uniref:AMP-binding protein n=1 Tax=Saccharomonospora sp. NB11 TaxID=1642298 RepID=UPI0018D0E337|nr:AMP-binding protein [Saccharomonospora sp. NB11]